MGTFVLYSSQLLVQENSSRTNAIGKDCFKCKGKNYEIVPNTGATIAEGREPAQVPGKTSFLESSRARRAKRGRGSWDPQLVQCTSSAVLITFASRPQIGAIP